jgi:acyl-coenzyme A synthetase/AMP-(fatty) acid ligase
MTHPFLSRLPPLSPSPPRLTPLGPAGDAAYEDEDGYIHIMARADDVINVAAHRLSTGTMEAVISAHPAVAECAVIGPADELKGQVPWGVVVLKRGYESADLNTVRVTLCAAGSGPCHSPAFGTTEGVTAPMVLTALKIVA